MAKKKNYISVLITNFNKEKYIYKSLKSIDTQSKFNNYEIIIFDDGSTDGSLKIIKKFKRVRLIQNKSYKKKAQL